MLTKVNLEGLLLNMIEAIVHYKRDDDVAVSKSDMFVVTKRGQKRTRKTTCVCKLLVRRKDKSGQGIHLKETKESHPVKVAEFFK